MSVPITPPAFTILIESMSEASVVTTRPRAMGMRTPPSPKSGCPQAYTRSSVTAVTVQAALIERSPCTSTMLIMSPAVICESSA